MSNIRKWLEAIEDEFGEKILAIVVGKHDSVDEPSPDENILLNRDAGLAKLDYDFDNGYGGADCHPFYAWTKTHIIFLHEYDGATWPVRLPRSPKACQPNFGGSNGL